MATFIFIVFFETVLGRKYSGKVSKKFIGNFNFWGNTLIAPKLVCYAEDLRRGACDVRQPLAYFKGLLSHWRRLAWRKSEYLENNLIWCCVKKNTKRKTEMNLSARGTTRVLRACTSSCPKESVCYLLLISRTVGIHPRYAGNIWAVHKWGESVQPAEAFCPVPWRPC